MHEGEVGLDDELGMLEDVCTGVVGSLGPVMAVDVGSLQPSQPLEWQLVLVVVVKVEGC